MYNLKYEIINAFYVKYTFKLNILSASGDFVLQTPLMWSTKKSLSYTTALVSKILHVRLVSGQGLSNQRSVPTCCPLWLGQQPF